MAGHENEQKTTKRAGKNCVGTPIRPGATQTNRGGKNARTREMQARVASFEIAACEFGRVFFVVRFFPAAAVVSFRMRLVLCTRHHKTLLGFPLTGTYNNTNEQKTRTFFRHRFRGHAYRSEMPDRRASSMCCCAIFGRIICSASFRGSRANFVIAADV